MPRPQTLKLLLLDGTPTGTWIAELDNWDGKALRIPRKRFAEASKSRTELTHTGVYLLVGRADATGERSRVYVGEAEDLRSRLKQHTETREDWTEALVFTRKSNELNKAHVKYLERVLYDAIRKADRYAVTNGNTPARSSLHETDEYAMEDFAERVQLLTGVLGHPMFVDLAEAYREPPAPTTQDLLFELAVPKSKLVARMQRTDEGYVVLKDSHVRNTLVASLNAASRRARQQLIDDGSLIAIDGQLTFQRDTLFSSPSAAGMAVTGRSTNGWTAWISAKGTLAEVYRSEGGEQGSILE